VRAMSEDFLAVLRLQTKPTMPRGPVLLPVQGIREASRDIAETETFLAKRREMLFLQTVKREEQLQLRSTLDISRDHPKERGPAM
jgi:hypothetical protein